MTAPNVNPHFAMERVKKISISPFQFYRQMRDRKREKERKREREKERTEKKREKDSERKRQREKNRTGAVLSNSYFSLFFHSPL